MSDHEPVLPSGAHLASLSHPDHERGVLHLPLSFESESTLEVRWEKIPGFDSSDRRLRYTWGPPVRGDQDGAHYLGQLVFGGEVMDLEGDSERFSNGRLDPYGNLRSEWTTKTFDTGAGVNVTPLLRMVALAGGFSAQAPTEQPIHLLNDDGYARARLRWTSHGGAVWQLEAWEEYYNREQDIQEAFWSEVTFDFAERTATIVHNYGLTDHDLGA